MYAEAGIVVPFIVMVWKRMGERAVYGGRVYAEVLASLSVERQLGSEMHWEVDGKSPRDQLSRWPSSNAQSLVLLGRCWLLR